MNKRTFTRMTANFLALISANSRKVFLFVCFLVCQNSQAASTVISGTLTITNYAALTNATSGQSYTLNSDTRTFTNSVADAATQIRVRTNDSAATILLSIAAQAGAYPFTPITSMTTSAGTNITFRATNDTALTITLSPANWGKVTYSTQTVGTAATIVRIPYSIESAATQTNVANALVDWLNLAANTNTINATKLQGAIAVGGTNVAPANLANSASVVWARSGSNITASSSGGSISVGGTNVAPANLADSATVTWAKSGSNITATASAGIAASEVGWVTLTNGAALVTSTNVATNSIILLSRYASDGIVLPVNEVSPRVLGHSFSVACSDTNAGFVFWQLINRGTEPPVTYSQYAAPFAYFRLDETNVARMIDMVGGLNLTNIVGTITRVTGQLTNSYAFSNAVSDPYFENASTNYNFANQDWAIRFWVNKETFSPGNEVFWASAPTGNDGFLGFFRTADNHVKITTVHGGSTDDYDFTTAGGFDTNSWHRVVFWRKAAELGVQIDNGSPETQAMLSTVGDWETWQWKASSANPVIYDDIAVWRGYVPSSAEMLYDWNAGAGRSYPLGIP